MKSKKLENKDLVFNKEALNYLGDKLSQEDKYAFEKQLHEDDFDFDAMEGLEDFEAEELIGDKKELESLLSKKSTKRNKAFYYRLAGIAAAVGIIITVGSIFFLPDFNQKQELISEELHETKKEASTELDEPPIILDEKVNNIASKEAEEIEETKKQDGNVKQKIAEYQEEVAKPKKEERREITLTQDFENTIVERQKAVIQHPEVSAAELNPERGIISPKHDNLAVEQMANSKFITTGYDSGEFDIIIKGKVVDYSSEQPLPGVNLVMEEARLGTMTDMNGNFQIKIPAEHTNKSLKVNYIGFVTEEIPVKKDTSIVVALTEDILALDEVVVVNSESKTKKRNETGSVSVVEMPEGKAPLEEAAGPIIGFSEYRKYLNNNIVVPESLPDGKTEKVKIKVTIHKDGKIRRVEVLSSPGEEFDKEAIRLLLEGPEWKAKTVNGEPVSEEVILKIKFKR